MSNQVDLLLKRAGLAILAASNLSCSTDGWDSKRTSDIGLLMDAVEQYLTQQGHEGFNFEEGDEPLLPELMSYFVNLDELEPLKKHLEDREARFAEFKARFSGKN